MRRILVVSAALAAAFSLSACGEAETPKADSATETSATETATTQASGDAGLVVSDAWSRAQADISKMKMTGAFGNITNTTDQPVHIVSATNNWSEVTELHETVMKDGKMVMQEAKEGFTIKPGETKQFLPGANHFMVMKMSKPLNVGDELEFVLTTEDGKTTTFTAPAKKFTKGNEPYNKVVTSPSPSK